MTCAEIILHYLEHQPMTTTQVKQQLMRQGKSGKTNAYTVLHRLRKNGLVFGQLGYDENGHETWLWQRSTLLLDLSHTSRVYQER